MKYSAEKSGLVSGYSNLVPCIKNEVRTSDAGRSKVTNGPATKRRRAGAFVGAMRILPLLQRWKDACEKIPVRKSGF